jgi:hypothetical protein
MVISTLIILFWKMLEKISNIFSQRITYEGKFLKSFGIFCLSKMIISKWIHSTNISQSYQGTTLCTLVRKVNEDEWTIYFLFFGFKLIFTWPMRNVLETFWIRVFAFISFLVFYSLGDYLMVQPLWDIILRSQKVMGLNKYCAILHF